MSAAFDNPDFALSLFLGVYFKAEYQNEKVSCQMDLTIIWIY